MTAVVDERALMHLNVGDFVAVMTHHMKDGKMHWTLGSVETPPYLRDCEIRLWERQKTEYYNEEETPANPETAELMQRIAQVKQDLQKSIAQSEELTQQLRNRRASIMQHMAEADQYVQESNAVRIAARDDVESIADRHWQELKSYRIPPKMVSVVIRAVMLLLSEDEARTWPQMQRVLRDFNFKRRITGYDANQQLSPERRDYILQECVSKKSFRYDRAMQGSIAVGPIYYWVLAQLDCGEAQSQKDRVDQEKAEHQKELRDVLKQISEQQKRITEYQELMDDLDDQLRMCNQHNDSSVSRSRRRSVAGGDRYADSFAAREGKEYLKPAFFTWKPTDRVIIVLRKNIVSNFNEVTSKEQEEGYNLSDAQIRELDDGLMRHREAQDENDEDDDGDMFRQDELAAARKADEDIMKEREAAAAAEEAPEEQTEATTQLQRKFEGRNWQKMLDRKRDAIAATFTEESAECLEVPDYYISIDDLTVGSLVVDFTAQHNGRRSTEELQRCVDDCKYPKLLALYEEEEEEEEEEEAGPEHQMKFGGDRWADIAPAHRKEIEEAFLTDTSAATGASREEIEVQDIRTEEGEGLTVDYSMADKSRDPAQVQEQVDAYTYPEVWALYQQLAGLDEAGPTHQVRFRGERWADIMPDNEAAIQAAFTEDTADALGISTRQVTADEMRYEGGLTVPYTVAGCSLDDDEVDAKAEDYGYPKTWALYDRLVAEAVGAAYQKAFDGEHWERVLQAARPEVSEAFCTDTANAVNSKPGKVDPRSVDTDQDRLLVSYNVGDAEVPADEVREDTREYPYPEMWALYQQVVAEEAEGTSNLTQRFDGEAWDSINDEMPDQVREAFVADLVAATGVDAQRVLVHDVKTSKKGMAVEYGVLREEGESAHAVRKAAKDSAYPATWALYEENKEKAAAAPRGFGAGGERESGVIERVFEGDDWDILVDGCPEDVNEAFKKDTARTLGTSSRNVRILSTKIGSLIVSYQIIDPDYEDDEIKRRVDEDDFPELLGMYRRRVRGGDEGEEGGARKGKAAEEPEAEEEKEEEAAAANQLDSMPPKEFMGEEWADVLAKDKSKLMHAFQQDTADALGVAPEKVTVRDVTANADTLQVDYEVADCPAEAAEAEKAVDEYAYPRVWDLYPSEEEAGKYEKVFPGEAWESVVAEREPEVKQAFQKDVAGCLKANEQDVDVRSVRATPEGLAVRYNVSHEQCEEKEEVEEMCASYGYPETWALYEEEGEKDWVVTAHQVGFDGDDWGYVLDDKLPELQQAFVGCTAELFGVRAENVQNATYKLGSLIVDFQLRHPADLTEDMVNEQLNACPYEPVWDLYGYHPFNPEETTESEHEVGFEGAGWALVLANNRDALEATFQRETAEALDTTPENVRVDSLEFAEDCLLVKTTVTHHVFQDSELVQEQLGRYPYDEVWALYEEDPEGAWATTSHQVGFDGDDWSYVLSARHDAVEQAFRECTGEVLDVQDDHITNLVLEASPAALMATFDVKHPVDQSEEEVNERLAACEYQPVWDLYIDHPFDPAEVETTAHEVGFEGDEWNKVMDTEPEQLREAVMLDTAEALDVTPNDVSAVTFAFKDGQLMLVTMNVQHPKLQDDELIKEQLSRCPFERVWALYEDAPMTPLEDTESGIIERRFEGDDWDILVEGCPEDLNAAFRKDAARTLGVAESQVRVVSTEIGSLIVKYQVVNPPGDDEELRQAVDEDEFPELMGLYRRRMRAGDDGGEEGGAARGLPEGATEGEEDAVEAEQEEDQAEPEEEQEEAAEEEKEEAAAAVEDSEDAGKYLKSFPGDNWEECVRNNRTEITDAFQKDSGDALAVPAESVVVRSVRTDETALYVGYDVEPAAPADEAEEKDEEEETEEKEETEVKEEKEEKEAAAAPSSEDVVTKTADYPYPSVWALYQDDTVTTAHALSFESRHWGYVVRRRRWELARALSDDTADATALDAENVVDVRMEAHEENLAVTVYVQHPRETSVEEIDQNLADAPFERVWALYELVSPSADLVKKFDGARWPAVQAEHGAELKRAFAEDTAKSMRVSRLEVEVLSMEAAEEEGLEVTYVVRGSSLEDEEMERAARTCPYPSVWRLYGGASAGHRDFEGEGWEAVQQAHPSGVEEAFRQDTANALGVPQEAVEVYQATADEDGLHVQYSVQPVEGAADEAAQAADAEKVQNYDYPRLWNLYKEETAQEEEAEKPEEEDNAAAGFGGRGDRESGELQRVFEGDDWDIVLDGCPEDADGAFKKGVADAVGVPASDVVVLKASLGSLVMDYKVRGCDYEDDEIEAKVADHEFPELMELYRRRVRGGDEGEEGGAGKARAAEEPEAEAAEEEEEVPMTTSQHQVGFDGEDWAYALATSEVALHVAFAADSSERLGSSGHQIKNVRMSVDTQMLVEFDVEHPESESEDAVDEALKSCAYERVWELYGLHPYDASNKMTSTHEIGFEGDDWDYVLSTSRDELERAFRAATGKALTVPASDVSNLVVDTTEDGIVITCDVTHNESRAQEEMQEELQGYPYEEVWALYQVRPYDENERVVTVHEMTFEGDAWDVVCELQAEALRRAVVEDTAAALNVENEDVLEVKNTPTVTGLVTQVKVSHSPLQDNELIQEELSRYGYEHVWALYESSVESCVLVKTFPGEHWPAVMAEDASEVSAAFRIDTSNMLNLPPRYVDVKEMNQSADVGLTVEYTVMGEWFKEEEIDQRSAAYEYPEVWRCYEARAPAPVHTTLQDCGFEGEDWDYTWEHKEEEVREAFAQGVADAIGVDPSDITDVNMVKSDDGIVLGASVTHPLSQDHEWVQAALRDHDFVELWRLYETRPYDPNDLVDTEHALTFEGEEWGTVVAAKEAALDDAVRRDTAEALGVAAEDVVGVHHTVSKEGLVVAVVVRHSPLQDDELIQQQISAYEYGRVWALYAEGDDVPQGGKRFDGTGWAEVLQTDEAGVSEAFRQDTANALGVAPEDVVVESIVADEEGMTVLYEVKNAETDAHELQSTLDAYPYPAVWEHYRTEEEEAEKPEEEDNAAAGFGGRGDRESGELQRVFEGDDWDIVLDGCPEDADSAFKKGVADAVGVPASDVVVLKASLGSLVMDYKVRGCDYEDDEIEAKVADHEFPELMELYRRRVRGGDEGEEGGAGKARAPVAVVEPEEEEAKEAAPVHTTLQDCGFEGEDWDYTWEHKEEEVREAFAQGVADAIGVDPSDITDVNMVKSDDGIVLGASVTHPLSQDHEWVQAALRDHDFVELWRLYETRPYDPNDLVDTEHALTFEGEEWGTVVAAKEAALDDAVRRDTAEALGVAAEDVVGVHHTVSKEGLVVAVVVRHSPLQDDELIQQQISAYEYGRVWALYAEGDDVPQGGKRFDGTGWAEVLQTDEAGVSEAFRQDTANALGVAPEDVVVESIVADEEGMTVLYEVKNAETDAHELQSTLDAYPYPAVWEHYRTEEEEAEKPEEEDNAAAGFGGRGDRESGELQRVFEGDDWDIVLDGCPEDADGAFKKGVADAVGVPASDVVVLKASLGSLVMDYKVRGCDYEDDEIEAKVADHEFPELMELYRRRVRGGDEGEEGGAGKARAAEEPEVIPVDAEAEAELPAGYARVALSVIFEGELWELVVKHHMQKLTDAFREDAAEAVSAGLSDVHIRECVVSAESVLVHFSVAYHDSLEEADMREKVDEHAFDRVWALYDQMEEEENNASDAVLVKRFEGADWDLAMEAHPAELEEAFCEDTAAALETKAEHVTVDSMAFDAGLLVHFRVTCVDLPVEAITTQVDEHAYPKVWALYAPRASDSLNASAVASAPRSSRKAEPLGVEEGVKSEDSVTYLRKALADARRERDMYMEQAEKAEEEVQRMSQRKK